MHCTYQLGQGVSASPLGDAKYGQNAVEQGVRVKYTPGYSAWIPSSLCEPGHGQIIVGKACPSPADGSS